MTEKRKHETWIWVVVIGGGAVLFVVFRSKGGATVTTSTMGSSKRNALPATMPNPAQASLDAAFLQARAFAIQSYDQTVLGEKTAQTQAQVMNNEIVAQERIAFNTNYTNLKETGLATNAATQIAQYQMQAQGAIARQAAQAQIQSAQAASAASQAQSSGSMWGNIFSGLLGGLGSIFGF